MPVARNALHASGPDDLRLLDAGIADFARIHGPRQRTEVYLPALALRHGAQFVTFDTGVPSDAALRGRACRGLLCTPIRGIKA